MEASAGTVPATPTRPPSPPLPASSSPPRRLGLLRCPNAETLGWGRAGEGDGDGDHAKAAGDRAVTAVNARTEESQAGDWASSEPGAVDADGSSAPSIGVGDGIEFAPGVGGAPVTAAASTTDDRHDEGEREARKACQGGALSVGKRRRLSKAHASSLADEDGEPSETEEPMKSGGDVVDRGGYAAGAGSSISEMNAKGTTSGSELLPMRLQTSLEYEPALKDDGVSPNGRDGGQILTVEFLGGSSVKASGSSSIVLGAISGRAILEVLDPPPPTPCGGDGSDPSKEGQPVGPEMHLDVFGYRIPGSSENGNVMHSKSRNFIVINRPSWMNSLPITVVCHWVESTGGTSPAILHVRVRSLPPENDGDVGAPEKEGGADGGSCYYGAHRSESYRLDMLPPNLLYPGNCTAPGSRACVVLESWREALDIISGGTMDYKIDPPTNGQKCVLDPKDAPGNRDRILLCGAKGVGKSTLLRYATNRMLSVPAPCGVSIQDRSNKQSVAILDIDCGQPELSPPGMLTLTVLSRPLLSDPPVHMVCGGSCDHYGHAGRGYHQHWNLCDSRESEKSPVEHEAAYFFGDITSKSDPDTFVHMASQLMRRYDMLRERISGNLPLIVNTDGWVKGLGFELLSAIICAINPGHIIQIMGGSRAKIFDMSSHVSLGRSIHVVPAFDAEGLLPSQDDDDCGSRRSMDSGTSMAAPGASSSDNRTHKLCAYFLGGHGTMMTLRSGIPGEDEVVVFEREKGLCDTNAIVGSALASMLPYAVPYRSVKLYPAAGLINSLSNPEMMWGVPGDIACYDIVESLNGSIVGLCRNPDDNEPNSDRSFGAGVPRLDCVGLGIVRSVDHVLKVLFVLTPVHPRLLEGVTSLVGAGFGLPVDCVYRGAHSDSFPYLSCGHAPANALLGEGVMRNKKLHSREKK